MKVITDKQLLEMCHERFPHLFTVEQEPESELKKDAANLLFALHDAWPYVHGHCTIEAKKKAIQTLMAKHGDFADLHPPEPEQEAFSPDWVSYRQGKLDGAAEALGETKREWVGLTDDEIMEIHDTYYRRMGSLEFAKLLEAKLKELNHD